MLQVDDTTDEIHIIDWRIRNFSCCTLDTGGKMESIASVAGNLYNTRWTLVIFPKGTLETPDYLGFYIRREDSERVGPETLRAEFEFSLVTFDGVKTFTKIGREEFRRGDSFGFNKFAKLADIFRRWEFLLQGDNLTIRCKIRRLNPKKKQSSLQKFVTEMPIEKKTISLTIGDFQSMTKQCPEIVNLMESKNLFSLKVSMNKDETSENRGESENLESSMESYLHLVLVKKKSEDPVQVWCSFKLLNEKKEVTLEKSFSHYFSKLEEDEWILPYFLDTSKQEEGCIEDGNRLYFAMDFAFSYCREQMPDLTSLSLRPNPKETTLMGDLDNLRKNSKFSDVILRIGEDRFPAHMSLLAARSARFDEILTDLKRKSEDQIREVEITDVGKKTMKRMLQFIYTDTLEEMDDESCLLLYSAAQNYQISSLVLKCVRVFRTNLSVKQVYKVLLIAEQFGDSDLKTIALDLIFDHYEYVLLTDEWQEFSEEHEEFSEQVMAYLRLKKQEKCD